MSSYQLLKHYGYEFIRNAKHGKLYSNGKKIVQISGTPRANRPLKFLLKEITR